MGWRDIKGWFDEENFKMFKTLKLPKKPVILESGTHMGRSTHAIMELWPDADMTTCDPKTEPQDLPNVVFHKAETARIPWPEGKQIDLLFIDDSHTHRGIVQVWNRFEGLVKKGGYIVFHDFHEEDTDVNGIRDFVNALPKSKVKKFHGGEFGGAVYKK